MNIDRKEIVAHTSLRGVAAFSVVAYHCALAFPQGAYDFGREFFIHAYLAVDLFFILSGFILFHNYRSFFEQRIAPDKARYFYIKRVKRIYPNYLFWFLFSVAAAIAVSLKAGGGVALSAEAVYSFILHLAMVQAILDAPVIWNTPLWSIAVEMISYAAFPFLVLALASKKAARYALFAAAFALLALVHFIHGSVDIITGPLSVMRGLLGFVIGMFLGAETARMSRLSDRMLSAIQAVSFAAALTFVTLQIDIAAIAAFAVLVLATAENRGAAFHIAKFPAFHFIGLVSYSLYLAHAPIIALYFASMGVLENRTGIPFLTSWPVGVFCVTAISLAAATITYRVIESGALLRWLSRPRPSTVS